MADDDDKGWDVNNDNNNNNDDFANNDGNDITMSQQDDNNDDNKATNLSNNIDNDDDNDASNDDDDADFDDDDDDFNDGDDDDDFGDDVDDDGDGWGDDDDDADINNDDNIMSGKSAAAFESVIPAVTKRAIESNCDEINMIPLFAAAPDLKSRSRIGAMVAIRVANLTNITADQLEVWGLTPEFPFIALKFEFGPFYLNEAKLPRVEVGMCKKLTSDAKLYPFRLSWTINERTANSLLTNKSWPPKGIEMQNIPNSDHINELMESSDKEYALCLEALKKCGNDESQALNILLDDNQVKKLYKNLPSVNSCKAEFAGIMGKISTKKMNPQNNGNNKPKSLLDQYQNADDLSKIKQVKEMFNINMEAAALAFQQFGYNDAVQKLADPITKQNMIDASQAAVSDNNNNDAVSSFFGNYTDNKKKKGLLGKLGSVFKNNNNNNNNNNSDDLKSNDDINLPDFQSMVRTASGGKVQTVKPEDFFRSIVVMNRHNFLLRTICFALKVLLNGNKYCMICDKALAFAGLKPTICSERFCQWRHDQIGLGFSLAAEILNRGDIVDLLVSMTYSAANAGRIQFFFPHGVRGLDPDTEEESFLLDSSGSGKPDLTNFDPVKFANQEPGQPKADINKLRTVIDLCPEIESLKPYAKEGDTLLKKELTKLHALLYPLLTWIVTSNRAHLRRLPENQRIKAIGTEFQFALCSSTPDREAAYQQLKITNGSFLAWHGSPMGNWHSILRMGLRNYSKTKHQSNGAAYGNGIYFGKNFSLSWGYCRPGTNPSWKKSRYGATMSCMALCEICYHSGDAHHHKNDGDAFKKGQYDADATLKKATYSSGFGSRTTSKTNRWVKTSNIYVVEDEKCVTTRFFLIFPKTSGYKSLDANSLMGTLPNVVRKFQ